MFLSLQFLIPARGGQLTQQATPQLQQDPKKKKKKKIWFATGPGKCGQQKQKKKNSLHLRKSGKGNANWIVSHVEAEVVGT
jgi:hypothetical protein